MAEKDQERAAKTRIVSHMNNDHHDSVVRYLQHYGKLSSYTASDGRMSDVDLNSITLTCHGKTYRIPFEPPMQSYREARERVVEIDKECRQALGQSDVTVREYVPPTGLYAVVFFGVPVIFLAYSQRWLFESGGPVEQVAGSSFAKFSLTVQPLVFWFILVCHVAEALYVAARKLPSHSVNVRSSLFWLWTGSVLVEGGFAIARLQGWVKTQREKQKH